MTAPQFVSYDFQPSHVVVYGDTLMLHKPSLRALAKDGTIWETYQRKDDSWNEWRKVG